MTAPDTSADTTALATYLRRLTARVDQLATEQAELRDDNARTIAAASTIQHILESAHADTTPAGPPDWPHLTCDQAREAWDALAAWISDVLVPWYDITRGQLPDCWALHRPVVVTLSWLHHTYRAAHTPGAPAHSVADWHTHFLPAALHTIQEATPQRGELTCTPGRHLADLTRLTPLPLPTVLPQLPMVIPGSEPAERRHWQQFLDEAVTRDLASRPRA